MTTIKGTPGQGLFGATAGFFFGFAAVALFGPTAERFEDAMELTPMMVGLLVAMPALSGSLLRIPFSAWVDSNGGRKPFLVLLTLSVIGMAGLSFIIWQYYPDGMTRSFYPLILFLGLLCGCGIATFSVGISQVSYWFAKDKQGTALGVFGGVGNLAPGIFSFILPLALAQFDLLGSYLAWLAFLIFGVTLYLATGRNAWYFQFRKQGNDDATAREQSQERGQVLFPSGSPLTSLKVSAAVWKTWLLVLIYFATFGGFIALTAWFPIYWTKLFGIGVVMAGTLTAGYSIGASLARVGGGFIADRLGGERTLIGFALVMAFGAATLAFCTSFTGAVIGMTLLSVSMGVMNAAVFKLVPQEIPQAVGGAAGWVGGLGALGGFVLPPVLGVFVETLGESGYARGFLVFLGLALLCLALALVITWTRQPILANTQLAPKPIAGQGDV